jgi:hypothetical protein
VRSAAILFLACLALAGCGTNSSEQERRDAGVAYCQRLQREGLLLEPMSRCLREYEAITREPTPVKPRPSHFFDSR